MNHWVMDYETLKTCFVAVFTHYKSDMTKVFIVCKFQNDTEDFINFLMGNVKDKEWHISYNGLGFDSQVTQHILVNRDKLRALSGAEVAGRIYEYAQGVIALSNAGEFLEYKEKQLAIKQIDVFKLNHWDNRAKRSSLKWIQFSMDWHNVQDMPLHHTHEIQSMEEVHEIVRY